MGFARSLLANARRVAYERMYARRVAVRLKLAIYTFTFDDVPMSARINGLPILEGKGIGATFYVASKLGEQSEDKRFLSVKAASELHRSGHHIACHTFTHYKLREGTAKEMSWDAVKNRLILSEALGGASIEHFSYPFGTVTLRAKRLINPDYKTLRSTSGGINHGIVDLTYLRATRLYSKTLDRKHIAQLISDNANLKGWLIFYTHGVDPEPKTWDITPGDLSWVVGECVKTRGEILNIRDAYHKLKESEEKCQQLSAAQRLR